MSLNIVLADNLTGACEIAGIAHRAGLKTRLSMDPEAPPSEPGTFVVVDTETRRLSGALAAARMKYFATPLPRDAKVFKKSDSILRGPVSDETAALASHLRRPLTLLVPANPLFDRCIERGRYNIGGVPLQDTPFGRDPLNPAFTDSVVNLLGAWHGPGPSIPVSLAPKDPLPANGLVIGDTVTPNDLDTWAARLTSEMLPAGGAPFFSRLLSVAPDTGPTDEPDCLDVPTLLLSGTTTPSQRALLGASPDAVPLSLEELDRRGDSALTAWLKQVMRHLRKHNRAIVYVDGPLGVDSATRGHISCAHAFLTESFASHFGTKPWHLIVEGGATAAAIASALGHRHFGVHKNWGPGMVTLAPTPGPFPWFTLKPGSYPWPSSLSDHFFASAATEAP